MEALKEFFKGEAAEIDEAIKPQFEALFNEWLIFDFKPDNKTSIAAEYFLKNPDKLPKLLLDELEQILSTQFYDMLEMLEVKKGSWLKLYSFSKKKNFKVWDKTASGHDLQKGTLLARIGKAGNRWYFVGGNPLHWPIYSTERYKKIFGKLDNFEFSVQEAMKMVIEGQNNFYKSPRKIYTKKEIKNIRKKLEERYQQLAGKYNFELEFTKIKDFIYNENYQSHFGDAFTDLAKQGIPEAVFCKSIKLFQDIWNFFPHKILGGECPAEKLNSGTH